MSNSGFLLVDKEKGITSYDVIRQIKRIFRENGEKKIKIGHGGTLDPFATGLLIIMLGDATKKFDYLRTLRKTYLVKAEFGYKTDTQDNTGEIIKKTDDLLPIDIDSIISAVQKLTGEIEQIPPIYSALKIKGKPAYELARNKETVELQSRKTTVYSFELVKYEFPYAEFRIECSSGTYVRTLINDLGDLLGCFATAVELRRERIGEYSVENAVSSMELDSLRSVEVINQKLVI